MRRDPGQDEEDDPLDAALGELDDLAELERRFAALDARLGDVDAGRATAGPDGDLDAVVEDDDPFSDLEAVLREHRALVDRQRAAEEQDEPGDSDGVDADDDDVVVEIERLCQDALDALESDEVTLAREMAMTAVRIDDEHPFPTFVLGLVAEREGDLDTARDMAELALRTAGTNADAIGLRAHIHLRQHEFEDAEGLLRFGIAHNPDEPTLYEGLARVALARGRHDEALSAAAAALRLEPGNPGAIAVRSAALEEAGDRGALLAALRQGVQLHPEDPYSMVELASVEMEHGNVERARVLLMRAQRLAPRDPEITDLRALVEHVHDRPLLRPVPSLLRWLRDFPGGLAGFLVGFVIAALPLHALAMSSDDYRIPALGVIAAWGSVALYAWIAPAVLTHRLNQRAARGGLDRLVAQLRDPCAALPELERIADVTSMLVAARDRRAAVNLLTLAARRAATSLAMPADDPAVRAEHLAGPLTALAARLGRPRARLRSALLFVPADGRLLIAAAVAQAVTAPALAAWTNTVPLAWHGGAALCLLAAWWLAGLERAAAREVDDAFAAMSLDARPGR